MKFKTTLNCIECGISINSGDIRLCESCAKLIKKDFIDDYMINHNPDFKSHCVDCGEYKERSISYRGLAWCDRCVMEAIKLQG